MKVKKGLLFVCLALGPSVLFCQQIREKVRVTNVEVVVRVERNGEALGGLSKGDFHLFENGKEKEINGFFERRRRIGNIHEELTASPAVSPQRMFLLYFWSRESLGKPHRQALEYFFDNIFRAGDEAVLIGADSPFVIQSPETVGLKVKEFLKRMNQMRERATLEMRSQLASQFTAEYQETHLSWVPEIQVNHKVSFSNHTGRTFVSQNMALLKNLARQLKMTQKEKWAFVFVTLDPQIRSNSWLLQSTQKGELDEVREEFIQSQTTFNLLVFQSSIVHITKDLALPPFALPMLGDNVRDAFGKVSKATGGGVYSGSRFEKSLDSSSEREDIYYVLTYDPSGGDGKELQVDIRVDLEGARVLYKKRVDLHEIRGISLNHVSFIAPQLSFAMEGFELRPNQGKETGRLKMKLEAVPMEEGKSLIYEKEITATEAQLEMSLKLNFPAKGRYSLHLEVQDLLSGKTASETLDIVIE